MRKKRHCVIVSGRGTRKPAAIFGRFGEIEESYCSFRDVRLSLRPSIFPFVCPRWKTRFPLKRIFIKFVYLSVSV
jgi:hypothetical protein